MKYIIGILGIVLFMIMLWIYLTQQGSGMWWAVGFWMAGYWTALLMSMAQDFEK